MNRRKPQQNQAGASTSQNTSRKALLLKARQERTKREEHKRFIEAQAYVRSFLTRKKKNRIERLKFDVASQQLNQADHSQIFQRIRRLLFFYDKKKDSSRLILISQQILKQSTKILQNGGCFLQIRRLLALHLALLNSRDSQGRDSLEVPLEIIKVFTCFASAKKVMDTDVAKVVTSQTILYLIKRGYYKEIRLLLDKIPPNEPSPPTPFVASIMCLLIRPFAFIAYPDSREYSNTVLMEFAASWLCPEMSDNMYRFGLPALRSPQTFPYNALVECLSYASHSSVQFSPWLLFFMFKLQSPNYAVTLCRRYSLSHEVMLRNLSLMSRLTANLCAEGEGGAEGEGAAGGAGELSPAARCRAKLHLYLIHYLNDVNHNCVLRACIQAGQGDWNERALEHVSAICHHLLLSLKLPIHKYK